MDAMQIDDTVPMLHSKQSRYDASASKPDTNIFDGASISDTPMSTSNVAQHDLEAKIHSFRENGWTDALNASAVQLMYAGGAQIGELKNAAEDFLIRELGNASDVAALSVALIGHAHNAGAQRLYQKCLDLVVFDLIAAEYSDSGSDSSAYSGSSSGGLSGSGSGGSDGEGGESGGDSNGGDSNRSGDSGHSGGSGHSTMDGSETSEESTSSQQKKRSQQLSIMNVFTELGHNCPEIMMKITERVAEITKQRQLQEEQGDMDLGGRV
jgi:hypothetical protein